VQVGQGAVDRRHARDAGWIGRQLSARRQAQRQRLTLEEVAACPLAAR
jgi:hypothetical protein